MRTIGNIERFLVIGIVVVIGAILAVAIKGADDLDGAYKKQAQAKANESRKNGGTALNRTDPARGSVGPAAPTVAKAEHENKGTVGTDPVRLSEEAERLLNNRRSGDGSRADPSAPPSGPSEKPDPAKGTLASGSGGDSAASGARTDADPQAPLVIKDDPKGGPDPAEMKGQVPVLPIDRPTTDLKREQPASTTLDWTYEVQPGDRLERVASTLYGERSMWKEILAANPAWSDPTRIRAGTVLVLPKAPVNTTATGLAHGTVKVAAPAEGRNDVKPADAAKTTSFKRVTSSEKYEVQKGDTLMSIAAAQYGTKSAWRMILVANAEIIADKDHIKPGTVLKLPAE